MVLYGVVHCGMVRSGMFCCGALRYCAVRSSVVLCGAVWCGALWYGAIWNVWYDISFYVMFFIFTGGSRVDQNSLKDRNRLLVVSNFVS